MDGKVRHETSFTVTKPVDPSKASGFMWHDLPNRGGGIVIVQAERDLGDVGLTSGWQADNTGAAAVSANHATGSNHWVQVPMARVNGQPVTDTVLARNLNRSGADSQPLNVMGNPVPYLPASLSTADAVLTTSTIKTCRCWPHPRNTATGRSCALRRCAHAESKRRLVRRDRARQPSQVPNARCSEPGTVIAM